MCTFGCAKPGLPGGVALLDRLHAAVGAADARAAPVLACLFRAAWRPYAEALERWLFTGSVVPPSGPFMGPAPAQLRGWLPAGGDTSPRSTWVSASSVSSSCRWRGLRSGCQAPPELPAAAQLAGILQRVVPPDDSRYVGRLFWQGVLADVPAFLRPWQRQVALAGVQLRVLYALPAPLDALGRCLAASAAAEVAATAAACLTPRERQFIPP